MRPNIIAAATISAIALASACLPSAEAAEFKLAGSTTVVNNVIAPNKAAIEQETGLTLTIVPNGSAAGLRDFASGKADVAMISAPLASESESANKASPNSLDSTGMRENTIGTIVTKVLVNPANPVKTLTPAQLTDVFSGKIANWKEVGGADQPILVVTEPRGNGTRTMLVSQVLGGTEIAESARVVQALPQAAQIVAQAPNAISFGNGTAITSAVAPLSGVEATQPLLIITKGEPTGDAKKLIEVLSKYAPK